MPKYLLIGQYVPGTVAPKPHRCPNRKLVSDGRHGPSPTIILLLNDESAHPALPTTTRHPSNIDASILEMVESPLRCSSSPRCLQARGGGRAVFCTGGRPHLLASSSRTRGYAASPQVADPTVNASDRGTEPRLLQLRLSEISRKRVPIRFVNNGKDGAIKP